MAGMDLRERVGLNLQRLRRSKDLSQEELADRARVHQTYLSGVERGKRNPSLLVLERIAQALGTDVEELVRKRR
jgi:transcriptional regulator with XRE-family HTH domain